VDDFRDERGLYAEQIATGSGKTPDDNPDVWTWSELSEVLTPEELDAFAKAFGVKEEGNLGEDLPAPEALIHANLLKGSLTSLNDPLVQSARGKLREWSMTRWPSRKEHVSSVATNALVAFGLLNAGERFHPEAAELLSRTEAIYWDDKAKVLKAAAQSGKARSAEASSNGYALYVRALLTAHQKLKEPKYLSLARKLQAVLDKRFWSQEGPYLIAPTDKEYLPPLLSFVEDGFASANAISIHNLRQLTPGKEEAILRHVPEEASYAPEQYPELLVAGLRR
ncbi:MAG: hypothetical protein KJT03_09815, partial [Verrucomicrobiae bacterium]|nr:hypothetical protein [Verrucomicrobiae bacterium]